MDLITYKHQNFKTTVQSTLWMLILLALLGFVGWLWGGMPWAISAILGAILMFLFTPVISPYITLKMYRGVKLSNFNAPQLYQLLKRLSQRAGLTYLPTLYYIPSPIMNAFAVGSEEKAVIGISDGLISHLHGKEIVAVLAHEISHIKNNDMRTLGFAGMLFRVTQMLSWAGQLLLLINLPLALMGNLTINWGWILLLILAPQVSLSGHLALSRTREYAADIGAARLIGDPALLAAALTKIEQHHQRVRNWRSYFGYGRRTQDPLLYTHPPTRERVRRLINLDPRALNHESQPVGRLPF